MVSTRHPPLKPSGVRFGTPALTTRGMKEAEMRVIAKWIAEALEHRTYDAKLKQLHGRVSELAESFPLYGWLRQSSESLAEPEAAFAV